MGQFGIGQPVVRKEDKRFLTGGGQYLDDIHLDGETVGHVVRAPIAHAKFTIGDLAEAMAAPGVLAVLTGADVKADDLGHLPCRSPIKSRDGSDYKRPPYPLLAQDRVMHVGDAVLFIVAETLEQAVAAADLIEIDYEELPAVASAAKADGAEAVLWPDIAPNNQCFDFLLGDDAKTEAALKTSAKVIELEIVNNRVVVNSMEARGAIGDYDAATDKFTLYTTSQGSHGLQAVFGDQVLKCGTDKLRVVTKDVGGGFGMKIFAYREQGLAMWAAKKVGRPVRWISDRSSAFMSDIQGRDHVTFARLGLDENNRFTALDVEITANLGAYLSGFATFIPTAAGARMYQGLYSTPAVAVKSRGYFTNTVPVDAYRGAGRPEAAYLVERLVDKAAFDLGIPAEELRRINFIKPSEIPFKTQLGDTYDSGDFNGHMTKAMERADWVGFAARKAQAAGEGKLRGIGLACYVEACGGGGDETATVNVEEDGSITVLIGTMSNGQGHETAYGQIVSEHFDVPLDQVNVIQGDTDLIATGKGTGGSRSVPVGGASLNFASERAVETAKKIASHLLEAAEVDIEVTGGDFIVAGTDKRVTLADIAKAAKEGKGLPDGMEPGLLTAEYAHQPPAATFPNGTHVCELEIDEATGTVEILRYTVVDDFGAVVNPLMLAGQVHGGVAQGVGQALMEHAVYDEDTGQLVTGSFMDYAMPRADSMVQIDFSMNNVPCTTNPLGIKGAGEAGAIGAPPAVINAICNALKDRGVGHVDMPATPETVWQAIQSAKMPQAAD
ncbi:MAG: xanthine dehydrogenase family protein molybdopterin-binding subunit [Alphaproteobacteria bacterium]|nr:xanthine dehydrogenase family protein molybdopterin-binding subunit [Alphaproteobacteria bacterium]